MNEQDLVQKWQNRIATAEKLRNNERDRQGWLRFLDEYQGKYDIASTNNIQEYPPINFVYSYIHTEIPKLYFRDPYITVNPKGKTFVARAKILEQVINYIIGEIGLKRQLKKALMDVLMTGHGWIKYGYSGSFGKNPQVQQAQSFSIGQVMGTEAQPPMQVDEFVKDEEVFAVHVPWDDILFDNDIAKDPPYDCRWIAHRIIRPLAEVKGDPQYRNTGALKPNVGSKELYQNHGNLGNLPAQPETELVELWEVHDKENNAILAVAKGHDQILMNKPNIYEMAGLPFSMLRFNDVPGKPYPLSDIQTIEPQGLSRIRLRAIQLTHIKRWNRQVLSEKGALPDTSVDNLEKGVDGAVIEYEKGFQKPEVMQYGQMQSEIFTLDNLIQRDFDATVGQLQSERGGQAATQTGTLGELQDQINAAASRSTTRQDAVEDFVEEIARKLIQLLKQFQTTERYVRITGEDPQALAAELGFMPGFDGTGISFTKDDIQGEYDIEVKAGTTMPLNKTVRARLAIEALKLGPAIGIMPGGPVSVAIGKEFFRDLGQKALEAAFDEEVAQRQAAMTAAQSQAQLPLPGVPPAAGTPQAMPPLPPIGPRMMRDLAAPGSAPNGGNGLAG